MYIIKKGMEYFFPKINKKYMENAINILSEEEKKIFFEMSNYDKYHSLEVLKKIKNSKLNNEIIYLKLALLHDCGKGNTNIITRVLHKIGFNTRLKKHSELGFEKIKNIDKNLAILIKNHHNKNYSEKMNIFQKCDDES